MNPLAMFGRIVFGLGIGLSIGTMTQAAAVYIGLKQDTTEFAGIFILFSIWIGFVFMGAK